MALGCDGGEDVVDSMVVWGADVEELDVVWVADPVLVVGEGIVEVGSELMGLVALKPNFFLHHLMSRPLLHTYYESVIKLHMHVCIYLKLINILKKVQVLIVKSKTLTYVLRRSIRSAIQVTNSRTAPDKVCWELLLNTTAVF